MDFITSMPEVDDLGSILVVVDHFYKYIVFMTTPQSCFANAAAKLFLKHVKIFGLPNDVISDRDAQFTDKFWTCLFKLMGSKLKFSIANHPQIGGQMKQINDLLEEYLRHYLTASQKNWVSLLDAAQFCYNLHKSSTIGLNPMELVLG